MKKEQTPEKFQVICNVQWSVDEWQWKKGLDKLFRLGEADFYCCVTVTVFVLVWEPSPRPAQQRPLGVNQLLSPAQFLSPGFYMQ